MELDIALKLAEALVEEHVSPHVYGLWSVELTATRRVVGRCSRSRQEILLSRYWIPRIDEDKLREVVLHEIAHVRTPSWFDSHGPEWRANARQVGLVNPRAKVTVPNGHAKWIATCPGCKKTDELFRLGAVARRGAYVCTECADAHPGRSRDFALHYVQQY